MKRKLTATEIAKLRAATLCAEKTIVRWNGGQRVQPVTDERLTMAARELGLDGETDAMAIAPMPRIAARG